MHRPLAALFLLLVALLVALPVGAQEPPAPGEIPVDSPTVAVPQDMSADSLGQAVENLLAIYGRLEGLREVRILIEDRILELQGSALSQEDRERAESLASEVPGIVWVDNRIVVETDLRKRFTPMMEQLAERADAALRFTPSLLLGLLVLILSVLLARVAGGWIVPRRAEDPSPFARNLVRQAIRGAIVVAGILLALELIDATALVGAVLGAAGVMGIAVGFAFRDIVENYLAGVLLSLRQPFGPNDHVAIEGHEGQVARLTGRETVLMTLDGNHLRIPNAMVFKSVMTNYSRNPRRRFVVVVGVHPDERLGPVLELGREVLIGLRGVLAHPPPSARVRALGDSTIELEIAGWVDQATADFTKVRAEAHRAVKERFEEAGIATPPPEIGVRVLSDARTAEVGTPEDEREPTGPGAPESTSPKPDVEADFEPEVEPDIEPDTTIDDEIARERAVAEDDLLAD